MAAGMAVPVMPKAPPAQVLPQLDHQRSIFATAPPEQPDPYMMWQPPLPPEQDGVIYMQAPPAQMPMWPHMPTFAPYYASLAGGPFQGAQLQLDTTLAGSPAAADQFNASRLEPTSQAARMIDMFAAENRRREADRHGEEVPTAALQMPLSNATTTMDPIHFPFLESFRTASVDDTRRREAAKGKSKGVRRSAQVNFVGGGDTCPICLAEFERGDIVYTLYCRHTFHQVCLDGHFQHHYGTPAICPICRRMIDQKEINKWKWLRPVEPKAQPQGTGSDESMQSASSQPHTVLPIGQGCAGQERTFLVQTQLPDGRMSIIVDPGAWTNLAGGKWVRQLQEKAIKAGHTPKAVKLAKPLEVQGVGKGTQSAIWNTQMPIAISNDMGKFIPQVFEVPTLEGEDGADVPALLGLRSMRGKSAVLEMAPGKECLTFPGEGGYKIEWSPGTQHYPLTVAPSGHYVIPCDSFHKLSKPSGGLVEEKTVLHAWLEEEYYAPHSKY